MKLLLRYNDAVADDKVRPVIFQNAVIRTPPFSVAARIEAGNLLWRLQNGEMLMMPQSRPMPSVGPGCHELRIRDADRNWRIIYHIDGEAGIVILNIFAKKTEQTPASEIAVSRANLLEYRQKKSGQEND